MAGWAKLRAATGEIVNKNLKYRNDPEFRARVIRAIKERHKRNSSDPEYRRLINYNKRIYALRQSLERHADAMRKLERRLFEFIAKRDVLREKRKHAKASQ